MYTNKQRLLNVYTEYGGQ